MNASRRLATLWWYPVVGALLGEFPQRQALGAALAALTVAAGVGLLGLSGWFIVSTAVAGMHVSTALAFDVFMPSAGIRLLALGRTASRYGERLVTHDATLSTSAVLRERLFLGWARVRSVGLLRRPAQALFRLTGDLDALEAFTLRLLVPLVAILAIAAFLGVALGIVSIWLGLAIFLLTLLNGLGLPAVLAVRARRLMVRRMYALERLRAHAIDMVSGQTDLVMASQLQRQRGKLTMADARLARLDRALNRLDARAGLLQGLLNTVVQVLVLFCCAVLVQQGHLAAAGTAMALLMVMAASEPFVALRRGAIEAGRLWLAMRRLAEPLSAVHPGGDHRIALPDQGCAVTFDDVSVQYSEGRGSILMDINLTVRRGERVAVIGASGAGKSTLLAAVRGEVVLAQGVVRAKASAWLGQRTDLFRDSLRENLLLANPQATDEDLWQALHDVCLDDDVRGLPAGLDTLLGEAALGVSGGQARRLALARLLLLERDVWLLDEPTESLDSQTASIVLRTIDARGAGKSWLLVTHLRREAVLADRIVVLDDGRIVADHCRGSPGFEAALDGLRQD